MQRSTTEHLLEQFMQRFTLFARARLEGRTLNDGSLMLQDARRRVLLSRYRVHDND